jgi:replicative DNA helicase
MKCTEVKSIPEALRQCDSWVLWKRSDPEKALFDAKTGRHASVSDPSTWSRFSTVSMAANANPEEIGLGFVFSEGDGLVGIDLDHVYKDGELTPEARHVVDTLDSYTEISPSGDGIHMIARGRIRKAHKPNDHFAEMYQTGRFFRLTGNVFEGRNDVNERPEAVSSLEKELFGETPEESEQAPQTGSQKVTRVSKAHAASLERIYENDIADTLRFISKWENGDRVLSLYGGDMTGFEDESEDGYNRSAADLALCNYLAVACHGDPDKMDAMFRLSKLMRDKWDVVHDPAGNRTYGQMTIDLALENYTPVSRPNPGTQAKAAPPKQTQEAPAATGDAPAESTDDDSQAEQEAEEDNVPETLADYIGSGTFESDIDKAISQPKLTSGFHALDVCMGGTFYPGLYILGAISSLGKTTLLLQIADHLACSGADVLYFSLEQSRFELTSKLLSRRMHANGADVTAIDIRRGKHRQEVAQEERHLSEEAGSHLTIVPCNFETNVYGIVDKVKQHIERTGRRPIVFIDYLQIIPPADPRMTDKFSTDTNVHELKRLQADNDLVMFVVSSLNRVNYEAPVDFESFKESGGIEYTADVVWGLQLTILNDKLFTKEKNALLKRKKANEAKGEIPRSVDLVCRKNRYGRSDYAVSFEYDPRYDTFKEATRQNAD